VVRLIVPYPAGGRRHCPHRQRPPQRDLGAAGGDREPRRRRRNIASEMVARSAPDGYTLYLAGEFQATNLFLYPKLSYDPVADFDPVSLVVQYPVGLVVPNSSPARTVSEFIAHAKANAGKLTMATPGHGTGPHLAGEMFKCVAGIELTHVPYRGAAPALQDVVPGRVDSFFNNIAAVVPLKRDGQLRIIAVTTAQRAAAADDVPTVAESGMPGFDVAGWYAFFVPAKTPPAIVRKIHADTAAALRDPAIKRRLEQLGLFVVGSTPEELGAYLKAELAKWGPVIKEAGLKVGE
jgi:tripartite-type tricarboxylate transporter receptor subunit TctC